MSIFTPVDVRGPDARRKQLLQKLMGQAQSAQGAATQTPMPVGMRAIATGEGRSFRNATDFHGVPKINVTQGTNIIPSILARLGAVGTSHPAEYSPGPGRSIGSPQIAAPGPPQAENPQMPTPPNPGVNPPHGGPPIFGNTLGDEQPGGQTPFAPTPAPPGDTFNSPVNDRIPLGGGLFYDPVIDAVLRGSRVVGRSG